MIMDLADLRMFRTIVEAGSVTRAAERLNTVQSNVTTRLRQLEEDLGTPLFDRINRRLVITPAGTLLAGYAEKLLSLADEARDAVRRADQPEGLLRLGAMETTAAARLPGVIAAFRRAHPRVELRLRTAPTPKLVQEVLTHQLDAALVSGPLVHPELECRAVVLEELVLISAADWAPIEKASDLVRHGPVELFTFREGCSYRQRLLNGSSGKAYRLPAAANLAPSKPSSAASRQAWASAWCPARSSGPISAISTRAGPPCVYIRHHRIWPGRSR